MKEMQRHKRHDYHAQKKHVEEKDAKVDARATQSNVPPAIDATSNAPQKYIPNSLYIQIGKATTVKYVIR